MPAREPRKVLGLGAPSYGREAVSPRAGRRPRPTACGQGSGPCRQTLYFDACGRPTTLVACQRDEDSKTLLVEGYSTYLPLPPFGGCPAQLVKGKQKGAASGQPLNVRRVARPTFAVMAGPGDRRFSASCLGHSLSPSPVTAGRTAPIAGLDDARGSHSQRGRPPPMINLSG